MRSVLIAWLLAGMALCAHAREADTLAADPAFEARVLAVAAELRCLVCQNQTIADSNADLAVDLRKQIREKLQQGLSEKQILEFMVARYGDFVLYRPPLKANTMLLWGGPFLLLLVAAWALARAIRQRRVLPVVADLSPADLLRARRLLAGSEELR